MRLLRAIAERLLSLVFRLTGIAVLAQGLAFVGTVLLWYAMPGRSERLPWLGAALVRGAIIGATFVVGGIAFGLISARRVGGTADSMADRDEDQPLAWRVAATIPTLALPAMAVAMSWKLMLLWNEVFLSLDRLGLRAELEHSSELSGLIFLPIAAVLFFPALESATAFFLIVVPPLLLALVVTRSPRFVTFSRLTLAAQATFVLASLAGADLFAWLVERSVPYLQKTGGAEAVSWVAAFTGMRETLMSTAWGHAALLVAGGACLGVLLAMRGARAGGFEAAAAAAARTSETSVGEHAAPAVPEPPSLSGPLTEGGPELHAAVARHVARPAGVSDYGSVAELPPESRREIDEALGLFRLRHGRGVSEGTTGDFGDAAEASSRASRPQPGNRSIPWLRSEAMGSIGRIVLFVSGALVLWLGACELAAPRPRYVSSSPSPGGSVPWPPAAVIVGFDRALDPASTISVQRTLGTGGSPNGSSAVVDRVSRLGSEDPADRSLKAGLRRDVGTGIYRVDWRVISMNRGDARSGSFYFGIGMPVPKDLVGRAGAPFRERDAGARQLRGALLAGLALVALAVFLPRLARRG
jgi:methionine-rich copper-binding protein CopC